MNWSVVIGSIVKAQSNRLSGGVLQLTLGISLIISMLCASMILLVYYSRLSQVQSHVRIDLMHNAESALHYLMATRESIPYNQIQAIDLFGVGKDSVELIRKPWGVYEVLSVRAFRGEHSFESTAIITCQASEFDDVALYIPENNAPIYLAGNANLEGKAFLPKRGLTTGYINGRHFEGRKLKNGQAVPSSSKLPPIDETLLEFLYALSLEEKSTGYLLDDHYIGKPAGQFSFFNPLVHYVQNSTIEFTDSVSGNMLLHARNKVVIHEGAYLEDAIVIAPEIEIEDGFIGSAQFFATKMIRVGDNVQLLYPSALGLLGTELDSAIIINKDALVQGQIIIRNTKSGLEKGILKMEGGSHFHGVAYVDGVSNIEGSIWGTLITKRIQASVLTQAVENHILDGTISSTKRSAEMPASLLWGCKGEWTVAKKVK